MGVKKVTLHANIDVGGYAWARFGFTPTQRSWDDLRESMKFWVNSDEVCFDSVGNEYPALKIPERQRAALTKILDNPDPRGLWKLADARIGERNIGKGNADGARLGRRDAARRHASDGTFQPLCRAIQMTIIFDGPPGTKLGGGEGGGMHGLLADDDLPTYELPDDPDKDEVEELKKAASATLSAAEAAERKVAQRIYTALRVAASAADQIATQLAAV